MANYKTPDFWTLKAQRENYPARSVFKLKEIDEKFGLLPRNKTKHPFKVLDLGAAPGSWSMYVLRRMKDSVFLVSCDLTGMRFESTGNLRVLKGDFTQPDVRAMIAGSGPYNLILSDAAPATSGSRVLDTDRSLVLAEAAMQYADTLLFTGGHCAVKLFQGGETAEFLKRVRPAFDKVKVFKPAACRSSSFETYLVALGKKQCRG
ncbi:MAG: RlmE family RNA methyltransferase [Spirochaetaceae bacterium]|nr:RlmE family RNA methyltransferase [Spirochaetaceae bacterium]